MKAQEFPVAATTAAAMPAAGWRVASAGATVVGAGALVAAGAHIRVPVPGTDVPMTLQLLAVLLVGLTLSPRRAAAALLLYVLVGVAGLPVFAPGSLGLSGSTGGYIVGFVPAAWLTSVLRGSNCGAIRLMAAAGVGTASVLAIGVAWRVLMLGGNVGLALSTGLAPFVGKALVELLLAVTLVAAAGRLGVWRGGLEGRRR